MNLIYANKRRKRIKLIFNPASGAAKKSSLQLVDVIKELQTWKFVPELFLTEPDTDYTRLVSDSIAQGIRMFVICGGDGTVSAVAKEMLGTNAVLGIIPTGTQNNVALSLGIPTDIRSAIKLLRTGKIMKTDIGIATCGNNTIPFLEICSVGLFSALFQSGDEIQHGDVSKIGDFLSTLTASTPSKISLLLDNKHEIQDVGYVVLVSNMPYIGRRFRVAADNAYTDGLLDVLLCTDVSKLDLMLGYILKKPDTNAAEDPRIKHYKVRNLVIETDPPMPIMIDGFTCKEGTVKIGIRRHALAVIAGTKETDTSENSEG
ncbi:MAG: diacylglycerol/lipid kinase family protein [Acetivibrionales bacterium]|jgi:diacylglycerol kinase (ATP)